MGNIFKFKVPKEGEIFDQLLQQKNVKIERIVSSEQPQNIIYQQNQDEWVLVLEGEATLDIDGKRMDLMKGDYIFIPAEKKHRVLKTKTGTIWLAVHIF